MQVLLVAAVQPSPHIFHFFWSLCFVQMERLGFLSCCLGLCADPQPGLGLSHACHSSTRMWRGLISSEQVRPTVQASLAPVFPSHLTGSQCRLHARRLSWRGAALLPVVSAGLQGAGSRGSTVTGPGQGFAAPGLRKALANPTHSSLHRTESFWGS